MTGTGPLVPHAPVSGPLWAPGALGTSRPACMGALGGPWNSCWSPGVLQRPWRPPRWSEDPRAPAAPAGAPRAAGPQELRGPQRPRGGCVREKYPGPFEGPRKAPRCLGVRGLFLRDPGGQQGLPCPGPAGPRAPGTPTLCAWGARRPGTISLTTLEGPQGS